QIRVNSAKLLLSALTMREMPYGTLDPNELGYDIEPALYDVRRNTSDKYKSFLRSGAVNLTDKKNGTNGRNK
ncbi:hypothetical protein PENTCL1PPCAC_10073, partial [Pristionchus entomophagus]